MDKKNHVKNFFPVQKMRLRACGQKSPKSLPGVAPAISWKEKVDATFQPQFLTAKKWSSFSLARSHARPHASSHLSLVIFASPSLALSFSALHPPFDAVWNWMTTKTSRRPTLWYGREERNAAAQKMRAKIERRRNPLPPINFPSAECVSRDFGLG